MPEPTVATDLLRVLAAFVLLLGSGLVVGRAWGLRGYSLVLGAAPLAFGLTEVMAIGQTRVAVPWRPVTWALAIVMVSGAGFLLRRLIASRAVISSGPAGPGRPTVPASPAEPTPWWVVALIGATTLILATTLLRACAWTFLTVSQTWDAAFHTNAIRGIYEFGAASPLQLRTLAAGSEGLGTFYPAAFSPFAALFGQAVLAEPVVASNIAAVLIGGAVWPSCIAILARTVLGGTRSVTAAALALALGLSGMPWAPMGFGVLWSSMAAFAIAPLLLAAVLHWCGPLGEGQGFRWRAGALAVGAALLLLVCHPRVFVIVSLFVGLALAVQMIEFAVRARRRSDLATVRRSLAVLVALAVVALVCGALSRLLLGSKFQYVDWPIVESIHGIVLRALVNAPMSPYPGIVVAVFVALGVVVTIRSRRMWWLPVCWGAAILLEAVTAVSRNNVVLAVTRFWYADRWRIVPVLPLFSVILAVVGVSWLATRVASAKRLTSIPRMHSVQAVLAGALALTVFLAGVVNVPQRVEYLWQFYAGGANDPHLSMVSAREVSFFQSIARNAPADAVILNNPQDGSAFIFAYSGRRVTFPSPTFDDDRIASLLRTKLVTMSDHALVCRYLKTRGITHVYNGGDTLSTPMFQPTPAPGMQIPEGFWATTPVLIDGDLRLYKITGCDGARPLR